MKIAIGKKITDEYQNLCGVIRGLSMAEEFIMAALKDEDQDE